MNENSFSVLQTNIRRLLLHLGMCPTLLGYECLALAIELCVLDKDRMCHLLDEVYLPVAKMQRSTMQRVERNIRHLVHHMADRGKIARLNELLGYKVYDAHDYPPVGELIGHLAEYIRLCVAENQSPQAKF